MSGGKECLVGKKREREERVGEIALGGLGRGGFLGGEGRLRLAVGRWCGWWVWLSVSMFGRVEVRRMRLGQVRFRFRSDEEMKTGALEVLLVAVVVRYGVTLCLSVD